MIKIKLLGQFSVKGRSGRAADLHTTRGAELLAFLVLEAGRRFHRVRLAEQFWSHLPENRGRRALNTELWRVSTALRSIGMDVASTLIRTQQEVGYVRQPDHKIDIDSIRAAENIVAIGAHPELSDSDVQIVKTAVETYRGELLESVYSDWCLLWRESLRASHTEALEFLLQVSMERQDWAAGLRYGRALLALDPLLEHVHRAVMRCHFHAGNRPLALRQYALCAQILHDELSVAPMDETRRIHETLLAVTTRQARAVAEKISAPPQRLDGGRYTSLQQVDLALANVNTARTWLESASQTMRTGPPRDR